MPFNVHTMHGFTHELEKIASDGKKKREKLLKTIAAATLLGGAALAGTGLGLTYGNKANPLIKTLQKHPIIGPAVTAGGAGLVGTGLYYTGRARQTAKDRINE